MRTILTASALRSGTIVIEGDEAHHARNVLRVQVGQPLRLCDGLGASAQGVVCEVARHYLRCEVDEIEHHQPTVAARLHVIVAPPKGARFEDMLRSLCELGVGKMSVLRCERSSGKLPRPDRAQRVLREALKQCGRSHLPELGPVVDFPTLSNEDGTLMLLDPQGGSVQAQHTVPPPTTQSLRLLLGPEGGLSPQEREHLIAQDIQVLRIAPHILRIETAAIAAAAIWIAAWESYTGD